MRTARSRTGKNGSCGVRSIRSAGDARGGRERQGGDPMTPEMVTELGRQALETTLLVATPI
ncbi:MAG: hypothetical protein NNA21_10950, partial [Nitrospira sp.]|nr:hypothetical protein [Nitrospira sp.]